MTGPRYKIRELAPMTTGDRVTRVFAIRLKTERTRENKTVLFVDGKAWCGACGGPTQAMYTHCYHARAVQRLLRRTEPHVIAPPWTRATLGTPAAVVKLSRPDR